MVRIRTMPLKPSRKLEGFFVSVFYEKLNEGKGFIFCFLQSQKLLQQQFLLLIPLLRI
jgi:hypothetical protein